VPTVVFFAQMRDLTGVRNVVMRSKTIEALINEGGAIYGADFVCLATSCAIWVNGETVGRDWAISDDDEVAFLPPISGG
jgi:molybdopterin converting factor small subunit